ncbi:hypothetical protein AAMO2058_001380500 [Amorphochlora amoebiformis]
MTFSQIVIPPKIVQVLSLETSAESKPRGLRSRGRMSGNFSLKKFIKSGETVEELTVDGLVKLLETSGMPHPSREKFANDFFRVCKQASVSEFAHEYKRMIALRGILAMSRDHHAKSHLTPSEASNYFTLYSSPEDAEDLAGELREYCVNHAADGMISLFETLHWYKESFRMLTGDNKKEVKETKPMEDKITPAIETKKPATTSSQPKEKNSEPRKEPIEIKKKEPFGNKEKDPAENKGKEPVEMERKEPVESEGKELVESEGREPVGVDEERKAEAMNKTDEIKKKEEKKIKFPHIIERHTKIIATLGPASSSIEMLRKLAKAGVNVFRVNFSHAKPDYSNIIPLIENLQKLKTENEGTSYVPAVLADLQGPKFRTGELKDHKPVTLIKGQSIKLVTSKVQSIGDQNTLTTGTSDADVCVRSLEEGHRIMINDGAIVLKVTKRLSEEELECEVLVGGIVSERKGINTPELKVPLPALTAKDKKDCQFVCQGKFADFIALSFVQRKEDVEELQELMKSSLPEGAPMPKIVCKIEKQQAVDCIDEILSLSDGIMVARGDLGVECSLHKLPGYQKFLIYKANMARKLVITATQMLESMIASPAPTRAEVSDVANACYDGTDAVMLSGESAVGNYPVETVSMMGEICSEAEKSVGQLSIEMIDYRNSEQGRLKFRHAIAQSAVETAEDTGADAIIFFCEEISVAYDMAKLRPKIPILVPTFDKTIALGCQGLFGCHGIYLHQSIGEIKSADALLEVIQTQVLKYAGASLKDGIVVICAHRCPFPSLHNTLRVNKFSELLDHFRQSKKPSL